MAHPERIVPDETESGIVALHLKRYEFAAPWCAGKEVLDAGCGVGYGTALLAERAAHVVGVDVSADTIAYASERYGGVTTEFATMDVLALGFADSSFDVVCSFELIEHVAEPGAAVAEAARVLRPDGVYVVSTPRSDATNRSPDNPFHQIELSRIDFESLLSSHFGEVDVFGQRRLQTRRHRLAQALDVLGLRKRLAFLRRASIVLGTPALEHVTAADVVIERDAIDEASELVAVCRRPLRAG